MGIHSISKATVGTSQGHGACQAKLGKGKEKFNASWPERLQKTWHLFSSFQDKTGLGNKTLYLMSCFFFFFFFSHAAKKLFFRTKTPQKRKQLARPSKRISTMPCRWCSSHYWWAPFSPRPCAQSQTFIRGKAATKYTKMTSKKKIIYDQKHDLDHLF